jgi:hypothetical protein
MNCANPACRCGLFDRPGGSIWLMHLDEPREHLLKDSGTFSSVPAPTKCFWLCAECSRQFIVVRWTAEGLRLARKQTRTRGTTTVSGSANPELAPLTVHASTHIEEEFLDIG